MLTLRRESLTRILASATLLLAAACAQLAGKNTADSPKKVAAVEKSGDAKTKTAAAPATKVTVAKPPKLLDLTGLRPGHMQALLGKPAVRRLDPPAQHWRYDGKNCSLHVFFYQRGGSYKVAHIDARAPRNAGQKSAPKKVARNACINQVWRAGPGRRAIGKS